MCGMEFATSLSRTKGALMFLKLVVALVLGACLVGSASGAASTVYTLGSNDKAVIGDVECTAGIEAGFANFLCNAARPSAKYRAAIFSNNILIYAGDPDNPIYS